MAILGNLIKKGIILHESLEQEYISPFDVNKAIKMLEEEMNLSIKKFTVAGISHHIFFAHYWYIGTEKKVNPLIVKQKLDSYLKELNDDYRIERHHALKEIIGDLVPNIRFYDYLRLLGKEGGQNKFPRVIKNDKLEDWIDFLDNVVKYG